MAASILIRDFSTVAGGGFATVHMGWCEQAARKPYVDEHTFVEDTRYHRSSVAYAVRLFRARFTVPVEVTHARCVELHLEQERAEAARWARLDELDDQLL
jgi:hypothetical protein